MSPYKKKQNSQVLDDGWTVSDGDGNIIAHLDTETMADILIEGLNRPTPGKLLSRVMQGTGIPSRAANALGEIYDDNNK